MAEQKPGRALSAKFIDSGREPRLPPDPAYPHGIDIDGSHGAAKACRIELPYPAPRCGQWDVNCLLCGFRTIVTAAGRADDPKSLTVACKLPEQS